MKRRIIPVILSGFMAFGILTSAPMQAMASSAATVDGTEFKSPGILNLNGVGSIKADPDMARINVGVDIIGEDAAAAQTENTEVMDKVLAAIKELGVKDNDIQTSSYNLTKYYNYDAYYRGETTEPEEAGYQCTHMLAVTVTDLTKLGEILDAAVAAGANQTYGIDFTIADQEAFYLEALKLAMENADKKAQEMADILDVTIGAPASVYESSRPYVSSIYMDAAPQAARNLSGNEATADVSLSTGKVEITADVSVTYEYDR